MRLAKLYRQVPAIKCKGLCVGACGLIVASSREAEAMQRVSGRPLTFDRQTLSCGYLVAGRCSVYDQRPLLCRLYGVVPDLPCEHGCEAERMLTKDEGTRLMDALERTDGAWVMAKPE